MCEMELARTAKRKMDMEESERFLWRFCELFFVTPHSVSQCGLAHRDKKNNKQLSGHWKLGMAISAWFLLISVAGL
jgi:hypothetical protein